MLLPAVVAILAQTISNRPRSIGLAVRAMVVLLLFLAIGFLAGTPYALLDHQSFVAAVTGVGNHLAGGHVVMARGWSYHATFTLRYGVGIPLLVAACAGACWLIARRPLTAALVLSFPLAYYVVFGSGLTVFARYMVPIVPFLCLAAAVAVDRVADSVGRLVRMPIARAMSPPWRLPPSSGFRRLYPSVAFDRLMVKVDTRVIAGEWIALRFPAGTSMYQSGFGYGHLQPKPRARYIQYTFSDKTNRFEHDGRPVDSPDVIVLLESPVGAYTQTPSQIAALVAADYLPLIAFEGITAARSAGAVYDQEDAFYAPFGGIENARRPGPNVGIYERRKPR